MFLAGKMLYKNAMGFDAVAVCIDFLKAKKRGSHMASPFFSFCSSNYFFGASTAAGATFGIGHSFGISQFCPAIIL